MGNCLDRQEKVIKVMKTDGKVLEYKTPMKVHQVLSNFSAHAISDTVAILRPDDDLLGGHFYHLVPLPVVPPCELKKKKKKKVRFSEPVVLQDIGKEKGTVRIKLVITKQELEVMLRKGGISIDDMISRLPKNESLNEGDKLKCGDENLNLNGYLKVGKPLLESIPEVN